jgi:N-formylglutamate amidohydrolase
MVIVGLLSILCLQSNLVEVVEGDLPIVITAAHGGTLPIPGAEVRKDTSLPQFVTVLDTRTDVLAQATAKEVEITLGKKPFVVIAKFARTYADANRPAKYGAESEASRLVHAEYHGAVRKAVDAVRMKFGRGILVDIHGQGSDAATVFRGTQNLKTVKGLSDDVLFGPKSFLGMLESQGIKIFPAMKDAHEKENPKFDGGYAVQTYGLGHENGILAIQLEFGGSYRTVKAIPETAKKLAVALKSHVDAFL